MKLTDKDIGGEIVKLNETYLLKDNKSLNSLILSSTNLFSGKSTRGHRHPGQEEIYFFVSGSGSMIVGNEDDSAFPVKAGDVVLIPDGAFHRVFNDTDRDLLFNCVFSGARNH